MGAVVRTCVACRRREDRTRLLRFGAPDGRLTLVRGGQGRSAYLCADVACFDQAARRGAFARTLRRPVTIEEDVRGRVLDVCMSMKGGEVHGQEESQ